jgi:hypothetical protein
MELLYFGDRGGEGVRNMDVCIERPEAENGIVDQEIFGLYQGIFKP